MKSLNKATLIGRVGQDPKIIDGKNDSKFATFSIVTSESRKNKATGDWETTTEWHNIVVYNAVFVETTINHVTKGTPVYVEGEILSSSYTDKNGQQVKKTDIVLKSYRGQLIVLTDHKKQEEAHQQQELKTSYPSHFEPGEISDEIPF